MRGYSIGVCSIISWPEGSHFIRGYSIGGLSYGRFGSKNCPGGPLYTVDAVAA